LSDFDLAFALSLSVSIIAVVLTYVDMRRRLKQEREFSKSMVELINTLREELQLFRKQSKANEDLELLRILMETEDRQWKRTIELGKLTGVFKNANDNKGQDAVKRLFLNEKTAADW
jgi:hypothetical protein